ncbi:MAG TPA: VTT domain-containing protein [Myxococcaceae bacterium]|nr:VTT domain-containing protein [Myxococcaceae bacterium]
MNASIEFLQAYGPMLVFASVLLQQAGVPIPCTPWLIASGALARLGHGTVVLPIALATVAASLGHSLWFFAGRHWGSRVLRLICRVSLEPESCVQRTENAFTRYGPRALVIAPFIPGLTTLAPPLAGESGMRFRRFLPLDGAGDLLWATTFVGLGWLAGEPFFRVLVVVMGYAGSAVAFFAAGLGLYLGFKLLQRLRFQTQLRVARLSPGELKRRLDAGEELVVVDLRHRREVEESGTTLPGALQISPDELDRRHREISRGREVVLFCS